MNYVLVKNAIKLSNWNFMKVMMKNAATHIIIALIVIVEQTITISPVKRDGKNLMNIIRILKNDIESNSKIVGMLLNGSRQIAYNAPEIAVMASGRHEVTSKGGQDSQTNSGHYSNLFVGRSSGECVGLVCSPGRWNAISKTGSLKNVGITAFTPNYK